MERSGEVVRNNPQSVTNTTAAAKIDELGLDWNNYGARHYNALLGRWMGVDALAEEQMSFNPYHYVYNNPIIANDPTGMKGESTIVRDNENNTCTVTGGNPNDGDKGIYTDDGKGGKGKLIGQSLTSHSFFGEDNKAVVGAIIDMNSHEGQIFIDDELVRPNKGLTDYILNAKGGEALDFKTRDIDKRGASVSKEQYVYRGSVLSSGKIASARDIGNVGAGLVAARSGLDWSAHRLGADALQSKQQGRLATEGIPTQLAQRVGFEAGRSLKSQDSYNSSFRPFGKNTIYSVKF